MPVKRGDRLVHHIDQLADSVMDGLVKGDFDAILEYFAPDATWAESGDPPQLVTEYVARIRQLHNTLGPHHHEHIRRLIGKGGFTEQHITRWQSPEGTWQSLAVCAVVRVGPDGRITSFENYFDRSALMKVRDSKA